MPTFTSKGRSSDRSASNHHFTAVVTGHDIHTPMTDNGHVTALWISTVVAGLLGGEVYVAETNDAVKKIIGCAVWFGPGNTLYDTPEQQQHALGPLMATFNANLQKWWGEVFLPKYGAFVNSALVNSALGTGVKHNSWHLQTLGVDPEYQQQGAATLLVNAIVEKARRTGARLCAEVDTDLRLEVFSKIGFEMMPKGNGGKDDCCETYTGVDGSTFKMWVMARGSG
ncbi:hypothetical protein B0H13DRAFT_2385837 [Mycena leptocephala]|nr:hypothetical protein B0H13DRAFT_2385837 [Mycena leptocephala]